LTPATSLAAPSVPLHDVRILAVDDRPEDLLTIKEVLAPAGYTVITARSGAEALKRLLEQDFAVVLLDVVMPVMDGFEVATTIKQRERSKHTPIIFLTAGGSDIGSIYRGYQIGAVDYLTKPVDRDVVRAKVGNFVDLYLKEQQIKRQADALREADRRERDLAVAELKLASELRYRNLADAVPHLMWTTRPDGMADYFNRRWFEYSGMTFADSQGWGWLAAVHPDDAARCEATRREAIATHKGFQIETRLRRAEDGAYRWHLGRVVPELGSDGRIVAWIGTYSDVEDLKQALQARDEFLVVASHELRTPLTPLLLRLERSRRATAERGDADPSIAKDFDIAVRQAQRIARLIDDLLDVARITTGQLRLNREPFDLAEVVRDVVERHAEEATRAACAVSVSIDDEVTGSWDRIRIEQVTTNLLSNALKYAAKKPVHVAVERDERAARLIVRDEGIGIAPEHVARIFDRFERVAPSRQYGGLGMGLYIARQIVEAHGGSIRAESELGAGTSFTVELPRASC
jgi:PAS domain S-box-containing protein